MELRKETICDDTLTIIREYYNLNMEPLCSILADDCVWLSIGNLLVHGAVAIKEQFKDGFLMPSFHLEEEKFECITTGCETQLMVLGEYFLHSNEQSEIICAAKQRATFCYRMEDDTWKLYHMHVSNEWNELVENEVFPIQISTQTYQYVQSLLSKDKAENKTAKLAIHNYNNTHYIDLALVAYVQAIDKSCILHMLNENRYMNKAIKDVENKLPSNFYRLHRSYSVNCDYITKVERYKLTLITGEELPIPKMRYKEISEDIASRMMK